MRKVAPLLSAFRSAADSLTAAVASGQAQPLEALLDMNAACQQQEAASEQVMVQMSDSVAPLYSIHDSL
jgi:hypothetical protein